MTGFASLLSSLGGQAGSSQPQQRGSNAAPRPQPGNRTQLPTSGAKLTPDNTIAGVKRKAEDAETVVKPKLIKTMSAAGVVKSSGSSAGASSVKPSTITQTTNAPYRGTARASVATNAPKHITKLNSNPQLKPGYVPAPPSTADAPTSKSGPKRGFASIMEKAKAAQEAAKAVGSSGIKHKPVERLSMRDRQRQQAEARQKAPKTGKPTASKQSKDEGQLVDAKNSTAKKKAPETSYKGTMKKPPPEFLYKGTMRALGSGAERTKATSKKGLGQDKYGGYASWSDLDDAEEEEELDEEEPDSDASSDMEGGWDDMEREELHALKYAKQEDQEAMEEEERLKREKLERKRRLLELSKSNAAKRKY